jgi:hypothetical protein
LVVASSDSVVLDDCGRWTNLAAEIITQKLPSATIIDLSPDSVTLQLRYSPSSVPEIIL